MDNLKKFWNARSPKQKIWIPVISLLLLIGVAGNIGGTNSSGGESNQQEEVVETETSRTEVQWENYAPEVKIRLDEMMEAKDCEGLQAQFDISDANNEATMNRVGHNNAKLMAYTDEAMRIAGCY
jgi:hypothetical protein